MLLQLLQSEDLLEHVGTPMRCQRPESVRRLPVGCIYPVLCGDGVFVDESAEQVASSDRVG